MKDTLISMLVIAVGAVALIVALLAVGNWFNRNSCEDTAEQMGLESKHSFSTGCMVKTACGWFPLSAVRDEAE